MTTTTPVPSDAPARAQLAPAGPPPLPPEVLYRRTDASLFPFETTAEVRDGDEPVGHDRAREALSLAVALRRDGYNVFAFGPPGVGKHDTVHRVLRQQAAADAVPSDWVYVHDFEEPHRPRCLELPAGRATDLERDMARLVEELRGAIPAVLASEEHRNRRKLVDEEFRQRQEKTIAELDQAARANGMAVMQTPVGIALVPVDDAGQVYDAEEFARLPAEKREGCRRTLARLEERLQGLLAAMPIWERERRARLREVEREMVGFAVRHLVDELRARWSVVPAVVEHLDRVHQDLLDGTPPELVAEKGEHATAAALLEARTRRYRVNVLVTHGGATGAPVVYEDHPTLPDLVGRVEHRSEMGVLTTDFLLIKPGALHRARGGYLVLDARKLLQQPLAYEGLKRALRSHLIRIESPAQSLGLLSTVTLDPEPVPLDVKIVLVGEPFLYYLLAAWDPDFPDLFKVAADFDDHLPRTAEQELHYGRLVAAIASRRGLLPLDRRAVARVVEHAARMCARSDALSTDLQTLTDVLDEADHHARVRRAARIDELHVQAALAARVRRADRLRERRVEDVRRGLLKVDTCGACVGQVNGLSVMQLGGFAFGAPSRITARVRLGAGQVVDIEREVALGGPIHSKGVLILAGFLGARYAGDHPLALAASLVFEQSYGGVEGDSASLAELVALLSALAEVPVLQEVAVTGSVDQHGGVQPVGGLNEKIEGFFDACAARGFTGHQGVVIPEANRTSLMLRADVVDAATRGTFNVWTVEHVDAAVELLTRVPAGRAEGGVFPPGSVNRRVADRLRVMAEEARRWRSATPKAN